MKHLSTLLSFAAASCSPIGDLVKDRIIHKEQSLLDMILGEEKK